MWAGVRARQWRDTRGGVSRGDPRHGRPSMVRQNASNDVCRCSCLPALFPRTSLTRLYPTSPTWRSARTKRQPHNGGLYTPPCNPGGIHMESMESTSHSIWIPWNDFWLRPQPFFDSTGPMDSTWNGHIPPGILDHSSWIPDGFHGILPTIPYGFQWIPWNHYMLIPYSSWNAGLFQVDSMECQAMPLLEYI